MEVAYLRASRHDQATAAGTELLQRAEQHTDGIVEVNSVDSQPFVQILPRWQLNCFSDVAAPQGGLYVALEGQTLQMYDPKVDAY